MKLPHALTLTALVAFGLTSCDTTDSGDSPASLSDPRVKISNIDIGPINPDDIQTAYTGTNFGLFLEYPDRNPNKQYDVSNVYWGYDSDTYSWVPETDVLWRGTDYGVNVYAYAPYSASVDDFKSLDFKIPFDQSGGTAEADLLTGSRYHFVPGRDLNELGQVDITLNHALIKLIVNTTLGDQYEGTSTTIKEVWLNDAASRLCIDLSQNTYTEHPDNGPQDILMHKAADNRYEAVFWYGEDNYITPGQKLLTIIMSDNSVHTVEYVGDGNIECGKAYSMDVKVGKDRTAIGGLKVANWQRVSLSDQESNPELCSVWDGATIEPILIGDGTKSDPWIIETAAQLAYMAQQINDSNPDFVNRYFRLDCNIDFANNPWPLKQPVYNIHFDGNNKVINNLYMSSDSEYLGLFPQMAYDVSSAVDKPYVKNLTIRNANIVGDINSLAGILAGNATKTTILNCKVSGSVKGKCVGGLAGSTYTANITNCSANVMLTCIAASEDGGRGYAGGIVGQGLYGSGIAGCQSSGTIVLYDNVVIAGGIAGEFTRGNISDCNSFVKNFGIPNTGHEVGGLIGHTYYSDIVRSSAYGKMEFLGTQSQGGGLIGYCDGNTRVSRCHFGGTITYDNDPENHAASFFGFVASYNTIEQCTYSKTSGITRAAMTFGYTDYRDNIKGI